MTKIKRPGGTYNYVQSRVNGAERTLLCRRPVRVPGVAPECEDDAIDDGRRRSKCPITLPRLKCLDDDATPA